MPFDTGFSVTIETVRQGLLSGFNRPVTLGSLSGLTALIAWIILWPDHSTHLLHSVKAAVLTHMGGWFFYAIAAFTLFAALIAALPISGRIRLARSADVTPSFSTGSWLSMMFCCGIGGGVVVYAVAEPLSHFLANPDVMQGEIAGGGSDAARAALKYTFLHWGLSAWACYAVLGLALALFAYRYGLPLTIRSVITPLFGRRLSGPLGHLIDALAIVAIVAGVATTMSYGVKTITSGTNYLAGGALMTDAANHLPGLLLALVLCAALASAAMISGVQRGMKWLSNAGTAVFFIVMAFFALHSAPGDIAQIALAALGDYAAQLPRLLLTVHADTSSPQGAALTTWQTNWTVFYWTWWLAFAPFVSLFIARISEGRTLRSFILGSALAPCGVCFAWFACSGTAALSLEMSRAEAVLLGREPTEQLFAAIAMLNETALGTGFAWVSLALVVLLVSATFASGVLAITTIAAAGCNAAKPPVHIALWALVAAAIIGALLAAGGTASVRDVMVISALPLSGVIALAMLSIAAALVHEAALERRAARGGSQADMKADPSIVPGP